MKTPSQAIISASACVCVIAVIVSLNEPVNSSAKGAPSDALEHIAAARDRLRVLEWGSMTYEDLGQTGMEKASAGVHLVRPQPDPHFPDGWGYDSNRSGDYWFWTLDTASLDEYDSVPNGILEDSVAVSFTRIFDNDWMTVVVVPDAAPGEYKVQATFDAAGIANVASVVGTQSSPASFVDWFGVTVPGGGSATEMIVAVISDNLAYCPVSANQIAAASGSITVDLAKGVDFAIASKLEGRLAP